MQGITRILLISMTQKTKRISVAKIQKCEGQMCRDRGSRLSLPLHPQSGAQSGLIPAPAGRVIYDSWGHFKTTATVAEDANSEMILRWKI